MMVKILNTKDEVLHATAAYFVKTAEENIYSKGRFTVALSGGSSPKGLFELLASEYRAQVEWKKVFFFFGDERYVPADHADSNALMAKQVLFDPLHIDPKQVFSVNTALEPKAAAADYQQTIENHFAPGPVTFDLILLGLGDDAHTASLFPGTDVVNAKEVGVKDVFLSDKQVHRITFTAPLINRARHVAFLVYGNSKATALKNVLQGFKNYESFPAQLINPVNGELAWFIAEDAASLLQSKERFF
jgi:6-phosphogluconolactonase